MLSDKKQVPTVYIACQLNLAAGVSNVVISGLLSGSYILLSVDKLNRLQLLASSSSCYFVQYICSMDGSGIWEFTRSSDRIT